jgi:hypothetical protein
MINVNAADAMKNITMTVRVTGMQQVKIRTWVGCQLIRLAAVVMGCGMVIHTQTRDAL